MSRTVLLAALVAALVAVPSAEARIVIGVSIQNVRPTDTEARFRAVFGTPDGPPSVGRDRSDYGMDFKQGRYHGLFLTKTHRAELISTTSTLQRTRSGVGPGVSRRVALARLHGERCGVVTDLDRGIDVLQCAIRRHGVETDFEIHGGRVIEVVLDAAP